MKERMRFVTDWERGLYSMVGLCERYGVSRKTGYKWVERYEREGPDGLREQSRACPSPKLHPTCLATIRALATGPTRQETGGR